MGSFVSLPERGNKNIKYIIFRVRIELKTCRFYSRTFMLLRHDWPQLFQLLDKIYIKVSSYSVINILIKVNEEELNTKREVILSV